MLQVSRGTDRPFWVTHNPVRRRMQQLGAEIRVTSDLGRSYKCIVKRRGYYTMEDWLALHRGLLPVPASAK